MGGYPDGCSQATHDRAFNELGPSPAELAAEADAQNDQEWQDEVDYPESQQEEAEAISKWRPSPAGEFILKCDARTIARVFVRLEQQIQFATQEGRYDDARSLCRIFGAASYHAYGGSLGIELGN